MVRHSFNHFAAFALALIISAPAIAATGSSSWGNSSSPSWMNNDGGERDQRDRDSRGRRSTMRDDSARNANLSPFSPGSNNLAIDIGQVFLMGDLGQNYSDSIGAQVHYTYGVSDLFGFDASFGYSDHSDGKFSMTTMLAGLRTNLAWFDRVVPYAVFGLGFYRPSFTQNLQSGLAESISPVLFGVHLGPGVDLQLTRQLFFGASLTFHDIFGSSRQTPNGPLSVGGTYTSFLVHAGFTF